MVFVACLLSTILLPFVNGISSGPCSNTGEVLKINRGFGSHISYDVCIDGEILQKTIFPESTGCLHIPHSLVKGVDGKYKRLKRHQCIAEDGKRRNQGYGVVSGG